MKNHLFIYLLLIFTVIFVAGCATNIPQIPSENNLQSSKIDQENNQYESTGVPRVVFIELFNTADCPASKAINPIIEEIVTEYENTEVILVELAGWGKHSTEETYERFEWYFSDESRLTAPAVCFNGLNQSFSQGFSSGGGGNSGSSGTGNVTDSTDINDSQSLETEEEPVIIDSENTEMVYPQDWATGDGTKSNPWANDCLNQALDAVPDGGTVYLKTGYYILSKTLGSSKRLSIVGEGMDKSMIITTMTNTNALYFETSYVTLKGFTINCASQKPGGPSGINIHSADYYTLQDLEVMNAGYYGINIHEVNHSSFKNIHAHHNYRHGLHPGSDKAGRNMYNNYQDIYAWNNGFDGFNDRGSTVDPGADFHNVFDNIQCWDNGRFGITICGQGGGILSNSFASGNTERGMHLSDLVNFSINNCVATLNGSNLYPGIYLANLKNINFTNVIVKNNYTGIDIRNSSNITLNSCHSYDDRGTPLQRFGLEIDKTNTGINLSDCKLSPNAIGEIYNPDNVAINIIKDKMLARL